MSDSAFLLPLGRVFFDPRSAQEVEFIFEEIFVQEDYRRHGITFAPGATIFDAGANIGLFSLYADRACGGDCAIYAFEPVPDTHEYLRKNLAEHGLLARENVRVFNLGLTRLGGARTASITVYPGLPGNSTMHPETKTAELEAYRARAVAKMGAVNKFLAHQMKKELDQLFHSRAVVECGLTTLSEIMRAHGVERVDLLKIDTEGAELEVIEGIDEESFARIAQVVLETNGEERARVLEDRLRGAGFRAIAVEKPSWAEALGLGNLNLYAVR